jgi:hypothetical protein
MQVLIFKIDSPAIDQKIGDHFNIFKSCLNKQSIKPYYQLNLE